MVAVACHVSTLNKAAKAPIIATGSGLTQNGIAAMVAGTRPSAARYECNLTTADVTDSWKSVSVALI